mmetsp:Transcript_9830/g.17287  ORF Transcript_9830/g.17287 Transcript_9830/m.17287 type:complete len:238 (+) Transcript_9830:99-812(+)
MSEVVESVAKKAKLEEAEEADAGEVVLHGYWRSSCSWRVRTALELKKIKYTYKAVHLVEGAQLSEEYSKLNAMRQVPTLVIDGLVLTQSVAILEYLEETRPTPALMPKDPKLRAIGRRMVEIINAGIQPVQNFAVLKEITKLGGDKMEWSRLAIEHGFKALEREAAAVPGRDEDYYMLTKEVTFADILLVPQVYNANRFSVDMTQFPILSKVNEKLEQLEAFKASHASAQPDAVAPA